jgi:dimethylaniline monooxygenase (N-oxide forming)
MHSHDYRTPGPFAGRRVLVVGAGQSATEIAIEVAAVARRTCMSVRSGVHVIPRWIRDEPYDARDRAPFNRAPWPLLNVVFGRSAMRELGPPPPSWPSPPGRLLEGSPVVSSDLFPAVNSGEIGIKPAIEALEGESVRFVDGSRERFDRIIQATGYEIRVPFISPRLLSPRGRSLPLYRRIVAPGVPDLFFAGFVDAPGGLLPVVEAQGEWIAAAQGRRIRLPSPPGMWRAIDRAERRTRRRFPTERRGSVRCDPHAYRRVLRSDLRRARRGATT